MTFWNALTSNPLVLLIPLISAVVGWGTNVVAIKMMLYPVHFVGIPPYLGWQGIIPAQAKRLADISVGLITEKLLSLQELFGSFQRDAFLAQLGPVADEVTDQIVEEVAVRRAPQLWANLGDFMQGKIRDQVRAEVLDLVGAISEDFSAHIEDLIDVRAVVLKAVTDDPALMGEMFQRVGHAEFAFIERSGLWFGLLFGAVQMVVWVVYPAWWVLPFAGFFVGFATNWLAIKLIFEPREPVKVGPFVVQGLFHKRQAEVAEAFAAVAAGQVLSGENISAMMLQGRARERLDAIVRRHVTALMDQYEAHPMASMVVPEPERPALRAEVLARIEEELPKPGGFLQTFASKAVDLRGAIVERMKLLDSESFEGVLRPAFQQDEWKLIAVGAVLGLGVGFLQLVYLFGEMVL